MSDPLDSFIDQWSPARWLGGSALLALAAGIAVVPLVGTAELVSGGVAVLAAVLGPGAAWWKHRLDQLPLEFAPQLAEWDGPLGHQLTVRGWLGRGRRIDDLVIEVEADGEALDVLAPGVPVLGRFQAVFPAVPGPVVVRVRGRSRGRTVRSEHYYDADARIQGRFHPGFEVGERWRWKRREWSRVG